MYTFDDNPDDAPVFYVTVIILLVVSTIYGVVVLLSGEGEKSVFTLTIALLFYVALYPRFFPQNRKYRN